MVSKVSQFQERLSLNVQGSRSRSVAVQSENPKNRNLSVFGSQESAFRLDLSRSLKVVEGEARKNVVSAFEMGVRVSASASGKLESNLLKLSDEAEEAAKSDSLKEPDNPFSPKNTAKRIVDFVRQALGYAKSSGDEEPSEEEVTALQKLQMNSVKEGFKQARGLLGNIPEDVSSGIDSTYDKVMDGLDRLFHPEKYADEETKDTNEETSDPADARFYSSQSFSLSFQLSVSAEGDFDKEELNEFVQDSFSKVQEAFGDYIDEGEKALGFNPKELFSKGSFKPENMMRLLGGAV